MGQTPQQPAPTAMTRLFALQSSPGGSPVSCSRRPVASTTQIRGQLVADQVEHGDPARDPGGGFNSEHEKGPLR